jgi:hypothetical protein
MALAGIQASAENEGRLAREVNAGPFHFLDRTKIK